MPYYTRPSTTIGAALGRSTTLLVPNAYDPAKSYPLYFFAHNYDDPNSILARTTADALHNMGNGCLVLAPNGKLDGLSNEHFDYWTTGASSDFAVIASMLAEVTSLGWKVDASRVYGVGYSNGAFMVRQLVDQNPSLFTAVVTIGGGLSGTNDANAVGVAVPGIHIHGDGDTTVLPAGDAAAASLPGSLNGHGGVGSSGYKSVTNTIADMCTRNGIASALGSNYGSVNLVTADGAGAECSRQRVTASTAGTAVERWTLVGVNHSISFASNAFRDYVHPWLQANHRGAT